MMSTTELEQFVTGIHEHPDADFYRNAWEGARTFEALPRISREALAACPLSRRTYKKAQGIARLVHGPGGPFLSAWAFSDIAREPYGIPSKRPLVYFRDAHDTVEKSMWSYLNGMVPLAGEKNVAVATLAARAYDIDSLISDPVSIVDLLQYLEARSVPLAAITLVSDMFRPDDLMRYRTFAERFRLVLALPETGAIATAELSDDTVFSVTEQNLVEGETTIVLTKHAPLITPVIRFDTGIPRSVISGQ